MDESRRASAPAPRERTVNVDPLVGRLINGRYQVQALIARGGMGKIYRAEQASLGRKIALKVLTLEPHDQQDDDFQQRFFLEASIAAKLTHPNTVTVHDYGKTDDDVYYIAMELLEGRTLHRALREQGPLTTERTVHVVRQVCRALREAHGHGVIHRDLKPANIFLVTHGDERDFVKVLDFGLVKKLGDKADQLTQTGLFMGSPKYMAPEQVRGEQVDARADVYALGVVMCELLTGRVPFDDAHSVNILMAHVHQRVPSLRALNPNVQVPAALEQVVQKCLAKRREDRWPSMDAVLNALAPFGAAASTPSSWLPLAELGPTRALLDAPPENDTRERAAPFATARRASALPLVLASALTLLGFGALFALALPTPSRPTAEAPEARAPAPLARSVVIALRSEPAGAMVAVGDKQYGPTPTEVELSGEQAADGREVTFRFRRTGYRVLTVSRRIRGPRMEVSATLLDPIAP